MRLELTGRHVDITPSLRRIVESKLGKLERLLNDSAVSAHAVLTLEKHQRRADITLHARGEKFLHGVGRTVAWESSVGEAIEKITQQALKIKGKWQARKGGRPREVPPAEAAETVPAASEPARRVRARVPPILRTTRQALRPMSVADATRALDADGDGVVVFRDLETAGISVLYRRRNGDLTLVQTEA